MLGEEIIDRKSNITVKGLGLLPVKTTFWSEKQTSNLVGIVNLDEISCKVEGYEIHHGITERKGGVRSFITVKEVNGRPKKYEDGAISGNAYGTYFHGIFQNSGFTQKFLNVERKKAGLGAKKYDEWPISREIDRFTELFESAIDIKKIERLVEL